MNGYTKDILRFENLSSWFESFLIYSKLGSHQISSHSVLKVISKWPQVISKWSQVISNCTFNEHKMIIKSSQNRHIILSGIINQLIFKFMAFLGRSPPCLYTKNP